ncbi:hypothetical protein SLEP1_g17599 [Rubroshorea leprosula]|uniref:Uncharacterized protein n=1 Tax=Rubroshorea leprosula TaxID=152421 RepID=A0AAV5J3W9_9ROSI|nr:hypothetical protein SLEP1_g17599 [Rubroshorea leprosula]
MIVSYINSFQFCNKGSETVGGRKRKNREISDGCQRAQNEGLSKDAKYRAKQKAAQQELEKENKDLKAKTDELERENMQLKWDKVGLEKRVLELKIEVQEAVVEKEKAAVEKEKAAVEKEKAVAGLEKQVLELKIEVKEAVVEKEKAVAEKEKAERIHIQQKFDTDQNLQNLTDELCFFKFISNITADGSVSLPFLLKLLKTYGFFLLFA